MNVSNCTEKIANSLYSIAITYKNLLKYNYFDKSLDYHLKMNKEKIIPIIKGFKGVENEFTLNEFNQTLQTAIKTLSRSLILLTEKNGHSMNKITEKQQSIVLNIIKGLFSHNLLNEYSIYLGKDWMNVHGSSVVIFRFNSVPYLLRVFGSDAKRKLIPSNTIQLINLFTLHPVPIVVKSSNKYFHKFPTPRTYCASVLYKLTPTTVQLLFIGLFPLLSLFFLTLSLSLFPFPFFSLSPYRPFLPFFLLSPLLHSFITSFSLYLLPFLLIFFYLFHVYLPS